MNNINPNFDPISKLVGKIIIVENNEKRFAARLIAALGNELWFEGRNGRRWAAACSPQRSMPSSISRASMAPVVRALANHGS